MAANERDEKAKLNAARVQALEKETKAIHKDGEKADADLKKKAEEAA